MMRNIVATGRGSPSKGTPDGISSEVWLSKETATNCEDGGLRKVPRCGVPKDSNAIKSKATCLQRVPARLAEDQSTAVLIVGEWAQRERGCAGTEMQ